MTVDSARTVAYRARWVVPVIGEPIAGGVVTVVDGLIAAVGRSSDLPPIDLGDVVVLPGLVNAHTHLEFSDLEQPLGEPGQVFPRWIRAVIAWRRGRNVDPRAAIELGLSESRQHGVVAIGEIATGDAWNATLRPTADVTVFHETICLQPARFAEVLATVDEFLTTRAAGADWQPGLSPHAPYTVHPRLLVELIARARQHQVPVAMHLAESRDELQLLAHGSGGFRELLDSVGIIWPHDDLADYRRPLDYLQALSQAPRALVVHGNYLTTDEIAFLAQHRERMSVVYCPRTHAYFGHERYPLVELLAAGVSVALGTDGRGSNPDLSILAEVRLVARQFPEIDPRTIVELATTNGTKALNGIRALGVAGRVGALQPGCRAELIMLPLNAEQRDDPYAAIVHGSARAARVLE